MQLLRCALQHSFRQRCEKRALFSRLVRQFFDERGFLETETPTLVSSPGLEPHIRPFEIAGTQAFLHTSPEFAMKKLLGQGLSKIFQLSRAYRFEPKSATHNPEFTMLEWYRSPGSWVDVLNDTQDLLITLVRGFHGQDSFRDFEGQNQDLSPPFLRFTIEECFQRWTSFDLKKELPPWDAASSEAIEEFNDEFFRIFLNQIEPELKNLRRPVFVTHYPWTQAALANLEKDASGVPWALRFELYAGGLELANAFDELTDPAIQRQRFLKDQEIRRKIYRDRYPESPLDEELLLALAQIDSAGGIALGVDRLLMYLLGASSLDDVLLLPSFL